MSRKIIVYIATSADGFIARRDGSVDWLSRPRPAGNYGMDEFFEFIDTILWGRKTFDKSLEYFKKAGGGTYGSRSKNYVLTHNPPSSPVPNVEFVSEPVKTFAPRLREQAGKD